MSFLSSVTVPNTSTAPPPTGTRPGGSFLSSVQQPKDPAQAARVSDIHSQAQVAKANADFANSFSGKALNTVKGLWSASGIPQQFNEGVEQSKQTDNTAEGKLSRVSGIATALSAPLAPIVRPITAAVNAVSNKVGDIPAVQKFANSPAGKVTSRAAEDVANASNVASFALGAFAGIRGTPKVKGGFLESIKTPEAAAEEAHPTAAPALERHPTGVIKTAAERHAEYARSQGYEPYTAHEELPVIKTGAQTREALPSIQTGQERTALPAPHGMTIEPIKETPVRAPAEGGVPVEAASAPARPDVPFSSEGVVGHERPLSPIGTGKEVPNRLAVNTERDAIAKELTESFGEQPTHNQMNMKEQAAHALDIINNDPEKAMRMIEGKEPIPGHIVPENLYTAFRVKALTEGDAATLYRLHQSGASEVGAALGQRIKALDTGMHTDPVRLMNDVAEARAAVSKKTNSRQLSKPATKKSFRETVRKSAPTKDEWAKFIDDIRCNY